MNRVVKWFLIVISGLIVFFLAVILIATAVIDVKKYRPELENVVSEATGRPFKVDGDLRLSLFPWLAVAADDIHLGSPPGFEEKDLVRVASFEMRVKIVPLFLSLFKDIQVKPFILKGARIVVETRKDGATNLEGIGEKSAESSHKPQTQKEKTPDQKPGGGLPFDNFTVAEFAVTDSSLVWIDHKENSRFEVSNLTLQLEDFSLDRPIRIVSSAKVDGHAFTFEGNVGPLGKDLGKGVIPVDLSLNALKQVDVKLRGSITDPASDPRFDLSVEASPFSPRKLFAEMGKQFPVVTADPKALTRVALTTALKGGRGNVLVSGGVVNLDTSTLHFSGKAGDFSRPNVKFDLKLDEIDLDRYLAPDKDEKDVGDKSETHSTGQKKKESAKPASGEPETDYALLRRLVLDGTIEIGKLKVANARIQDLNLKITGKNGVFRFAPLSSALYQGNTTIEGTLDVKKDVPEGSLRIEAKGISAGPLLKDLAEKDILEGSLNSEMTFQFKGDNADRIKKSLNGNGSLFVEKGAIKGIDLVAMVRNTDGAYGFSDKGKASPKTEFDEFNAPFSIKGGVFYTDQTRMVSTLFRMQAAGKADLVGDALNLRIEPTFVTTHKADKDKMKRSEVMVPVLVTGSLSSPKFRPDLKGIAEQKLEEKVFKSSKFKEIFEKEELKPYEEDAKDLLKGILDRTMPSEGKK